ncbi:imidazole glycerol phosphate synthase subunit HisH [Litorivicinus lipolyticus]|uniref:Imidazole glycerol phosphate synthase subunit HisH n=1 Tax=Litorivicinus lipolyticus TaxID=418701 RepID=A0A5Q2QFT0_9GAMM|nr:imidazole glycerol phosphate synthase subunit HisH [Litorivicinus lipolyticus]QGG81231.1 imidazole glycerol phosphate synthase subunit HisH [Litorivicinus lipolyticus]
MIVGVVDYGMGNLHSVSKALEHAGPDWDVRLIDSPAQLNDCDRAVLPGVGAMGACVEGIQAAGFDAALKAFVQTRPMMGVCVGMQALFSRGDESGGVDGMGWLDGEINHFPSAIRACGLKIPHMGWNQIQHREHPLFDGIPQGERFYFVHSFRSVDLDQPYVAATAEHGEPFVAAIIQGRVFATQFHPEKSQHAGLQLYSNFLNWTV